MPVLFSDRRSFTSNTGVPNARQGSMKSCGDHKGRALIVSQPVFHDFLPLFPSEHCHTDRMRHFHTFRFCLSADIFPYILRYVYQTYFPVLYHSRKRTQDQCHVAGKECRYSIAFQQFLCPVIPAANWSVL